MDKAAGDRSKLHLQQWLGFRMQFEKSKKYVKPNERNHYKPQYSTLLIQTYADESRNQNYQTHVRLDAESA